MSRIEESGCSILLSFGGLAIARDKMGRLRYWESFAGSWNEAEELDYHLVEHMLAERDEMRGKLDSQRQGLDRLRVLAANERANTTKCLGGDSLIEWAGDEIVALRSRVSE